MDKKKCWNLRETCGNSVKMSIMMMKNVGRIFLFPNFLKTKKNIFFKFQKQILNRVTFGKNTIYVTSFLLYKI